MKQALFGFRKIGVFIIATGALVYGLQVSITVLQTISDTKATQAASIAGAFFLALGTIFGTLMSAFKGGYARDGVIQAAQAQAGTPPVPPVP